MIDEETINSLVIISSGATGCFFLYLARTLFNSNGEASRIVSILLMCVGVECLFSTIAIIFRFSQVPYGVLKVLGLLTLLGGGIYFSNRITK